VNNKNSLISEYFQVDSVFEHCNILCYPLSAISSSVHAHSEWLCTCSACTLHVQILHSARASAYCTWPIFSRHHRNLHELIEDKIAAGVFLNLQRGLVPAGLNFHFTNSVDFLIFNKSL
jgi:hypothetical protein